jgi:hypothetical protein
VVVATIRVPTVIGLGRAPFLLNVLLKTVRGWREVWYGSQRPGPAKNHECRYGALIGNSGAAVAVPATERFVGVAGSKTKLPSRDRATGAPSGVKPGQWGATAADMENTATTCPRATFPDMSCSLEIQFIDVNLGQAWA